jgi:hypothetical protein
MIHYLLVYVYAFINPVLLPFGLFYTHLIAPPLLIWIAKNNPSSVRFLGFFVLYFMIYTLALLSTRTIYITDYILSFLILFGSITFAVYIYLHVAKGVTCFDVLMTRIILANFVISLMAVLLLEVGLGDNLWNTQGNHGFRLQLFFYEPSIYSLVITPFVIYAFIRYIDTLSWRSIRLLVLSIIPLLLSRSAGVIGSLILAFLIGSQKSPLRKRSGRRWIILGILLLAIFLLGGGIIERYVSFLEGTDSSGNVRIALSFAAAIKLIEEKGFWLGVGPGQLKYLLSNYTQAVGFIGDRLPNSVASTIATLGILGLVLKELIYVALYIRTHSNRYEYSRILFIFIFLYQFTGGYLNNVNEYVALAFAFGYAIYRQRIDFRDSIQ